MCAGVGLGLCAFHFRQCHWSMWKENVIKADRNEIMGKAFFSWIIQLLLLLWKKPPAKASEWMTDDNFWKVSEVADIEEILHGKTKTDFIPEKIIAVTRQLVCKKFHFYQFFHYAVNFINFSKSEADMAHPFFENNALLKKKWTKNQLSTLQSFFEAQSQRRISHICCSGSNGRAYSQFPSPASLDLISYHTRDETSLGSVFTNCINSASLDLLHSIAPKHSFSRFNAPSFEQLQSVFRRLVTGISSFALISFKENDDLHEMSIMIRRIPELWFVLNGKLDICLSSTDAFEKQLMEGDWWKQMFLKYKGDEI